MGKLLFLYFHEKKVDWVLGGRVGGSSIADYIKTDAMVPEVTV